MPRQPKYKSTLLAARDEAINAVEFYNRPGGRRSLEAFLVHMHIAWMYLLHAELASDAVKYFYKKPNGHYERIDGRKKAWDLDKCMKERWPDDSDPVRLNLDATIRLRNQIEHEHEEGLVAESAGFNQALIINFEEELVEQFGPEFSIADIVHIPVSLGTFSREGAARILAAQQALPEQLRDFFISVRNDAPEGVAENKQFEFRVALTQKGSSKTDADLAVSFVRLDDLDDEQREAYDTLAKTGLVFVRDKERPVVHPDDMLLNQAREEIERQIPFRMTQHSMVCIYTNMKIRPPRNSPPAERLRTRAEYCVYDKAHDGYLYTPKFVAKVVKECQTEEGFEDLVKRPAEPK